MIGWWSGLPRGACWAVVAGFGNHLYRFAFHPETGPVGPVRKLLALQAPSFALRHPHRPVLYTAEFHHSRLTTLRNDRPEAVLALPGKGPCHMALDQAADHLWVANYLDGSVLACPVDARGRVSEPPRVWPGLENSRAHCVAFRPGDRRAWVADVGANRLIALDPLEERDWQTTVISPRQILFADSRVLVVEEQGCHLSVFQADGEQLARLPLCPEPMAPDWTGAGLLLHPSLPLVYTTLRGRDLISVFHLDGPRPLNTYSSGGKSPRDLGLCPGGRFLWVVNQESEVISFFALEPDGSLREGPWVSVPSPTQVVF